MNRLHPIGAALVACLLPAALHAYTYPVDHQGGPRATATFVEDHGGWHGGIDLPRSNGATQVRATGDEKVFHVYTTDFKKVKVENNDNASVAGPWALELSHSSQKYMLDILAVRRVTPGKPAIAYHVDHVVETQPGFADDGVVLVANFPSNADSLVAGDQLEVDYAYYSDRIFQLANVSIVGTEYRYYSHIDGIHQYVAWNSYPATAANRFYGDDTDIPAGRAAHVLSEGEYFADIETLKTFASEPQHLHFGLAGVFTFPEGTTNPLSNIVFATDDPQGNRPYVRSIGLLYGQNEYRFPDSKLYGRVNILVESRDDMGSPEANDDGDGAENATREAGCYNAGYWITAEHGVGEEVASAAQPNKMFEGPGKDTITANDPLRAVLIPAAPYKIDVNTNYHLVVSHVEGDSTRFWNTRAKKGSALNDGSDAPIAAVNSEARFGDGRYQIHAKARDVVAYGATRDSMVTVDNFRPFVRKVVVRDDSGELYSGEWSFDGAEIVFQYADPDEGMLDDQGNKRCADGQSDVVIEVTFSEGMQDAQMSAIEPLGYTPTLSRMPAGQDTLWSATIPKAKLKTKREKAGRQILEIFGTDWANNDVRQISTPAAIDPDDNSRDGAVMRGPSGIDELHRFAICQPVALVCDVTGSMYDEIEDVRVAMREFIDRNEANPNRFPLYHVVTFEDDVEILLSSKKAEEARNVLNQLNAGFGGACPEASVSALDSLPSLMPGGGAAVLATDADPMEGRPRLDATIEKLRAQDIEVNTLLSGSCEAFFAKAPPSGFAEADYAAATRGNDDSPASAERSGGSDVPLPTLSDLFGTIDARVAFREVSNGTGGRYVESFPNAEFVGAVRVIADCLEANALLLSRKGILVAPSAQVEAIPVDASCSELIVLLNYALGDETSLALRRPNGTTVLPTDPDASITFAPGVASVHVNAPAAGEWSAEVACVSGHGRIELSALARSSRRAELGGTPNRRAGTLAPLVVTLEGAGAPSAFRLLRDDGSEVQPLSLFDDGLHDDGVAGDGTFGATVAIPDTGAYRIAVDALDQGSNYARETARTVVVGLPRIASADSLEFGALSIGRSSTLPLYVKNRGVAPLVVSGVAVDSPDFMLSPTSFIVAAGDMQRVDARWTPSTLGSSSAVVSIASDDDRHPVRTLVLHGEAMTPSELAFAPDTLELAVPPGDSLEVSLRVRNVGQGTATLAISDPAATSGPASSAYRYQTSFDAAAPIPFRWAPLGPGASTVGPLSVDGAAGPYPIGFDVIFFGRHYTEFYISENGHITLGGLPSFSPPYFGGCAPSSYFAPYLAPYLENLDLRHGGRIRWQSDGERLVVEYQDARRYDLHEQDVPLNCQIVLSRDGSIDFNYQSAPSGGVPLTAIGSGALYESVAPSCEIPFPARERTTLHFWRDNPWLAFEASADTLGVGDSLTVAVRANTVHPEFQVGATYTTRLSIASEGYDASGFDLPVRLTILPGPYALAGRVTAAEDGSGVADAIVTAVGPYGMYNDTTDANGDYLLAGLTAGAYSVGVQSLLYLSAAPEVVQVPAATSKDFALTRPIVALDPGSLDFTLANGDSLCLPLVIRNEGTVPLALDGIGRGEGLLRRFGPSYERILDDPAGDTEGPDLVALDVARSASQLDFRLTFDSAVATTPPYTLISLDVDRNAATGANPPAFGQGLSTQTIGAEFELSIQNVCGYFIYLFDAVSGEYLNGYFLNLESDRVVTFSVPLADLGSADGRMNVCVTALPGICDGGSQRPSASNGREGAPPLAASGSNTTVDWMPEVGHGAIGTCPWLSVDPTAALIAPGDSVTVSVCVDASALADTSVGCSVSFRSNDPRRPLAVLPVSAHVSSTVSSPDAEGAAPALVFALKQNDPNPAREATRIRFSLPREENVRLSIFDLNGRLVREVMDQRRPAGAHVVDLDARSLASGVYLYRLEAGRQVATRKMLVIN